MKVETRVLDVTSTLEGEKVGMTIDEGALAHIMSVLTDLYSDPELAVIREYSTNAFDAHVENGVTRPIEIHTPTPLSMFFKVRDYGEGLDDNDIRDIYSKYGASTKRESNDVVGMLGLGCKSALTYTDQFTVTGWKNGICTQVSVSRDEDGSGSMTIVAQYESDEPSGVEITVPAKRMNYFDKKADEFFRFWKPGTVLVNGKEPRQFKVALKLTDDLFLTEELNESVVVMGNVAYPMGEHSGYRNYDQYAAVAYVNIGEVHFTPSRESLQMTKTTKETLATIKQRIQDEKEKAVQRNVDAAKTHAEALQIYLAANRMQCKTVPTYKGQEIPTVFKITKTHKVKDLVTGKMKDENYNEQFIMTKRRKGWGKCWYNESKIYAQSYVSGETIFLVGYDEADWSPTKQKKLEQWADQKQLDSKIKNVIILGEFPKIYTDWIDQSLLHPWAEVKAQKIVRANQTRRDGRPTGAYEGYVDGVHQRAIKAEDIDTTKPVYYFNKTNDYNDRGWDYNRVFRNMENNFTYITLPSNRVEKFVRDFPMAIEAKQAVDKAHAEWKKNLTEDEITLLVVEDDYYRRNDLYTLRSLDETKVDDPDVKAGILLAKTTVDAKKKQLFEMFQGAASLQSKWTTPLAKYSLLTSAGISGRIKDKMKDEIYIYLNAVYAAGKAGN